MGQSQSSISSAEGRRSSTRTSHQQDADSAAPATRRNRPDVSTQSHRRDRASARIRRSWDDDNDSNNDNNNNTAAIDVTSSNSSSLSPISSRRRLRNRNNSGSNNSHHSENFIAATTSASDRNTHTQETQSNTRSQQLQQHHRRGLVGLLRTTTRHFAHNSASMNPSDELQAENHDQRHQRHNHDAAGNNTDAYANINDSQEPPSLVSAMNEPYPRTPTSPHDDDRHHHHNNNNNRSPPLAEFHVFSNSGSTVSFEEDILLDDSSEQAYDHHHRHQGDDHGPNIVVRLPHRTSSVTNTTTTTSSSSCDMGPMMDANNSMMFSYGDMTMDAASNTTSSHNNPHDDNNNNNSNSTRVLIIPPHPRSASRFSTAHADQHQSRPFYPIPSRDYEWMGRSIESLLLGHAFSRAPILHLMDLDGDDDDDDLNGADAGGGAMLLWEVDAESDYFFRRRSTASTFGGGSGGGRRRSSAGSAAAFFHHHHGGGGRRGSLSLQQPALSSGATAATAGGAGSGGTMMMHGGTLASYYYSNMQRRRATSEVVDRSGGAGAGGIGRDRMGRRGSTSHNAPVYRRRGSMASVNSAGRSPTHPSHAAAATARNANSSGGPNVLLHIMARESTGKSCFARGIPASQCLRSMGGTSLYAALDKPAAGIVTEVAFLAAAIDAGDWAETHSIVSRLVLRLIGDPNNPAAGGTNAPPASIDDPNLPPNAPKYYAGGGRLGLERDAFVQAGGVDVLIRMFREKTFCGQEMAYSMDARDLSEEIVVTRLAPCWNEALAALRELVYHVPFLVRDGVLDDNGDFLPFLFSLLSHDSCFDGAAALIEEILSFMSQTQPQATSGAPAFEGAAGSGGVASEAAQPVYVYPTNGRYYPATTFFLGNVPDLFSLWRGFNCRQLAHFCRILALLVFEPEDRQLLESSAVLKSLELLKLRRNRAARAGRDSTVDMNQSILLADHVLMQRLLKLLTVMNYAPPLRQFTPYHVMAHFPFIADALVMLGLAELEGWGEIDRQDQLARQLLEELQDGDEENNEVLLCELGTVAGMLEGLSDTLMGPNRQATNQIGYIIHVISAAQRAGVIVGRDRRNDRRRRRRNSRDLEEQSEEEEVEDDGPQLRFGEISVDGTTIPGLASVAGILSDQILANRLSQVARPVLGEDDDDDEDVQGGGISNRFVSLRRPGQPRHLINAPEDAANSLQFNAMLLGPYQVEVLFVLCTLLGGRRKLDAQHQLNRLGILPVLNDMFQRLPWYKPEGREEQDTNSHDQITQPNGIHGPGCDCTPESALCVQYLRLLHNFCDRDCDNYQGRWMLLNETEKNHIFGNDAAQSLTHDTRPGLLSKIIAAFIRESDESPYRFWLASCIESYLRGSSPKEQMFAARSGLLSHLVEDISSERLHCAGSLQTSFDLLGELSKGNAEVVRLIVVDLDEESFRKLMSVAAANLVDSNVFIRSLLLSLERFSARKGLAPLYASTSATRAPGGWTSLTGSDSRAYLTHSWWELPSIGLFDESSVDNNVGGRPSDWFPSREMVAHASTTTDEKPCSTILPSGSVESVGHFGWVFSPASDSLAANTYLPNTLERLTWFLAANQARLLRDLLGVVDLRNINHENICCLNTAVVITIFAHRRKQLGGLLRQLRKLNDEEKETKRRALADKDDDIVDRAFIQAMRYLDLGQQKDTPSYARRASVFNIASHQIGDRTDVMRNFREVLWFWMEYYTHRGRDRLSLEFSSHIRFQEWSHVVSLLAADDGSPTSLVCAPVRLPRSPYQLASRGTDNPLRGL